MRQWLPLVLHFRCLDALLGRHTVRARGLMLLLTQALSYAKVPPGMLPAKEVLPSRSPMLVRLCNSLHVSFVAHAPPSSSWSLYLSPHSHLPLCLHLSLSLSRLCDSVRPLSVLCDQSLTYSLNEPKGTQRARAACAVIGFWVVLWDIDGPMGSETKVRARA